MAPKKFLRDLPLTLSSGIAPIPRKFKIPPLDGSLALPEIYDWHFAENPNKTLFMYESEPAGYTHITYREVVPASHRASQWIASAISVDLDEVTDETPPVAIIATSDTITHFCVQLGLLKAGISYICITPRTSPAVVAHLAEKVGVNFAFHSSEPAVVALVQEASELMKQTYSRSLRYSPMPEFRDIFTDGAYPILKKRKYNMDFVATYSHSSGSSGSFPKPIPWTHAFILQVSMAPLFGDVDVCEEVFACHSVSMTHGTGQHFLAWIVSSGIVMAVFKPSIPAKFPTPEATYQALAKLGPDYIWVFANFLENWSADLEKVEVLKKAKRSIFVGSMLKKDVGDYLARCGVQIYPLYGMAEAGVLGSFLPPPQGLEWEYFPLTAHSGGHFVDQGDNLYELILVEDQYKRIGVSNSTFEGARAYETRDSFIRHPSKPGYWKACGRLDDRLVHPNGEKTNPVPMEHIIDMDPRVKSAIVFGNGRNRCGVLIQLEESFLFDPVDSDLLSTFRQYILPKVEAANKVAPSYSRIYPEMVMVSSPSKPFTYTEKGTLRRKEILKAYASEIDTLYSELDEGVGIEISFPADATYDNIVTFVQAVLHTIPLNVPEDEDVFRYGCTSLQATRIEIIIRSSLRKVLEDSAVKSLRNFVYEYQTPQAIAEYLSLALKEAKSTSAASHMGEMKKLLASLVTDFPIFRGISEHASAEISSDHVVILVTGTTGALGSNVLAEVLNDDSVSRIYALNRRHESVVLRERQRQAFFEQGLTGEQLDHRKLELLEGDLTQAHFGLDPGTFEEMQQRVTHIYHLAWDVNWLVRLSSFEKLLTGVRKLIDFALSSPRRRPPALLFSSSVGVYRTVSTQETMLESSLPDLAYAEGQGYTESKAIAERILEAAREKTALRPTVVRFGQISGGISGAWTIKEWFPTVLRSSVAIGMLPELQGSATFLSVNRCARALNDIRDSHAPFLHLVNPHSTPFAEISNFFSKALSLPIVPYQTWIQAIEEAEVKHASSPELLAQIPASTILDFFRQRSCKTGTEVLGYPQLNTSIAQTLSAGLRDAPPVGTEEAERWLGYWRKIQFI